MYTKDDDIHKCTDRIIELEGIVLEKVQRIKELESGSCRFNCKSVKQAFLAGFDAGSADAVDAGEIIDSAYYREVTEAAFKEWNVK